MITVKETNLNRKRKRISIGIEDMSCIAYEHKNGKYVLETHCEENAGIKKQLDTMGQLEKEAADYFEKEQIKYQNKANEAEEIALRIRENGYEKTVQYYKTLQNKMGGGK